MGLASRPVQWVSATYGHPGVEGDAAEAFALRFDVANSAGEPALVKAAPAAGSGVSMEPPAIEVRVGPGERAAFEATFRAERAWQLDAPDPFRMEWAAELGDGATRPVREEWALSVAPERRLFCPEAGAGFALGGGPAAWQDRMPFVLPPAAGASARFGVCADDEYVYAGVHVTKAPLVTDPAKPPFAQDGVEIRFDARGERERFFSDGEFEFADVLIVATSPGGEGEPRGAFYRKANLPPGVRAACVRVEGGYLAEAAVPAAWFDAARGCTWKAFRFNVCVNAFDGDTVTKLEWRPAWRSAASFPWSGTFYRDADVSPGAKG
jgi:hypothetical protein